MIVSFQAAQDALVALAAVVGFVLVFAIAIVVAAGSAQRHKPHQVGTDTRIPAQAGSARQPGQADSGSEILLH